MSTTDWPRIRRLPDLYNSAVKIPVTDSLTFLDHQSTVPTTTSTNQSNQTSFPSFYFLLVFTTPSIFHNHHNIGGREVGLLGADEMMEPSGLASRTRARALALASSTSTSSGNTAKRRRVVDNCEGLRVSPSSFDISESRKERGRQIPTVADENYDNVNDHRNSAVREISSSGDQQPVVIEDRVWWSPSWSDHNEDNITVDNDDDDDVGLALGSASCCSSNGSSARINIFADPEKGEEDESVGLETSAFYTCRDREETKTQQPSSEQLHEGGELSDDLDSASRPSMVQANSRLGGATAAVTEKKMPTDSELEEFFAAAENKLHEQFAEKYNYSVIKDEPLEGRYEWVRLKP